MQGKFLHTPAVVHWQWYFRPQLLSWIPIWRRW